MAFGAKLELPSPDLALPGRDESMPVPDGHFVHGQPLVGPFPENFKQVQFAMGCFWGAERRMWQMPGVFTTAVGYSGGYTANPSYEEVKQIEGLKARGMNVNLLWQSSLFANDQLPFNINDLPNVFTNFRNIINIF